jgi:hypothetical protein
MIYILRKDFSSLILINAFFRLFVLHTNNITICINMIITISGNKISCYSRYLIITFILLLTSFSVISGQQARQAPPPIKERLFFGGSFGLQFGSVTDIQVAPVVGLWVLPRVAVAVGPNFRYYRDRYSHTDIYGLKSYVQLVVIKDINKILPIGANTGIFLHLEDELLNLESSFWRNPPVFSERFYLNTILAGGGISQQIGRRSSLNIMVLWALNDSGYGIYSNPEIRVSFSF